MADNTELNPGFGGDVIITEDIGGVKMPVAKIRLGALDVDGGDVTMANPMPVVLSDGLAALTLATLNGIQSLPVYDDRVRVLLESLQLLLADILDVLPVPLVGTGTVVSVLGKLSVVSGAYGTVLVNDATGTSVFATIADVNVGIGAAISGAKIAPDFGSQTVTTTGALKVGSGTLSTTGTIRLPNAATISFRSVTSTDAAVVTYDASNNMIFGQSATAGVAYLRATLGGTIGDASDFNAFNVIHGQMLLSKTWNWLFTQSTNTTDVTTKDWSFTSQAPFASATGANRKPANFIFTTPAPVAGAGGTTGEFQLSASLTLGYATQAMADAPQTLSNANSKAGHITTTGANTGVRALTINCAPTAGITKFIRNNCTLFGITVQFASGAATATILPGTSAILTADGTNAVLQVVGT